MVNKQSQYSVGIKNVNENTMEDLEVSIKGTMELVNNYLKETEDKIQKLSDELKNDKTIQREIVKELMREIKANVHYFNRIHLLKKISYHFIGKLTLLTAEGYVSIEDLGEYVKKKANVLQNSFISADHKLSKEDIISTAAIVKAGYLSTDVIDAKVSKLKQLPASGQNLNHVDLHNAAMLISEGYMTAEDVGQYGHILLSSTGESPEHQGDYMGLYKMAGVYNNVP